MEVINDSAFAAKPVGEHVAMAMARLRSGEAMAPECILFVKDDDGIVFRVSVKTVRTEDTHENCRKKDANELAYEEKA